MTAWCPTCVGQADAIKQVKSDYGDEFDVLAIDLWVPQNIGGQNAQGLNTESEGDLKEFLSKHDSSNWIETGYQVIYEKVMLTIGGLFRCF